MTDQQLKLATDTIRALIDVIRKPISETNHIDRVETVEAAEVVLGGLLRL
jgi:hypothetical protein